MRARIKNFITRFGRPGSDAIVGEGQTVIVPEGETAPPRVTLTDGKQVYPTHHELKSNGQQKDYVVLAEEERAKGFVRPVRHTYVHQKCGVATRMGQTLAETYARNPSFYSGTFCVGCGAHFPVGEKGEFVWDDGSKVGT